MARGDSLLNILLLAVVGVGGYYAYQSNVFCPAFGPNCQRAPTPEPTPIPTPTPTPEPTPTPTPVAQIDCSKFWTVVEEWTRGKRSDKEMEEWANACQQAIPISKTGGTVGSAGSGPGSGGGGGTLLDCSKFFQVIDEWSAGKITQAEFDRWVAACGHAQAQPVGNPSAMPTFAEPRDLSTDSALREQYRYYNQLYFGGSLPDLPVRYVRLTFQEWSGQTYYNADGTPQRIEINDLYSLNAQSARAILLHEMVHVQLRVPGGGHDARFCQAYQAIINRIADAQFKSFVISKTYSPFCK